MPALDNPGSFTLGDFQIGIAGQQNGKPVCNLQGMTAASLQLRLSSAAGGTSINVFIQTTLDQGQSWFDVTCVQFTTTPGVQVLNLSGLDKAAPSSPTSLGLTPGTILDGPLGDSLQAIVISEGTYTGAPLVSVRGIAR
jgi:hypothetical protein